LTFDTNKTFETSQGNWIPIVGLE